jgi:ribose 1,5-bisphosphokinase PhnN
MNISIDSVFCLCRKDPKKTRTRIKANIPRDTIPQNRKDIRDITGKRKLTVTTAVTARRLATRVNSRTTNINIRFIHKKNDKFYQFTTHSQFGTRYSSCRTGLKTVVRSLFYLT